jgi:hypothetical protein
MKINHKNRLLLVLGFIIVLLSLVVALNLIDFPIVQERILKRSSGLEITLKNGELYEMGWLRLGNKITSTGGKINSYLMSPGKNYVTYSIIVGSYKVVGEDGQGEETPTHHIIVMDLDHKKLLTEIKPQSKDEPFIYVDRWISNQKLRLTEADGFATALNYIYDIDTNELRTANPEELYF